MMKQVLFAVFLFVGLIGSVSARERFIKSELPPRQVCCMLPAGSPKADHIRYALCALLHHATVSMCSDTYLDFYARYKDVMAETGSYSHHTAPGEGLCTTPPEKAGASCYWNDSGEFMIFLVNLAEETQNVSALFRNGTMQISRNAEVPPLSLAVIRGRVH